MRKLMCALISLALMNTSPILADSKTTVGVFDDLSNMVRITGNAGQTNGGALISLLVARKGASVQALLGTDLLHVSETIADSDGAYEFLFPWDSKKGDVTDCIFDLYAAGEKLSYTVEKIEEIPSEWNAVKNTPLFVKEGSAIDPAFMNDAPAGRHGFVQVDAEGDFYFENRPGEKVRFYGANLTAAAVLYPTQAQAETIAKQCASLGYNIVRLHAFDRLPNRSVFLPGTGTDIQLNTERLDRMEYLISRLKNEGIYVTLDILYQYPIGDIPSLSDYDLSGPKLLPFFAEAREAWKSMASRLLSHVNPYTGLALKDDPALVSVSPWNERLFIDEDISNPELNAHILADFNEYRRGKGRTGTVTSGQPGATVWSAVSSDYIRADLLE